MTLKLFEGIGIELEYALVRTDDAGRVAPVADSIIHALAGEPVNDAELGDIAVSNELARHVIELKTNGPAASASGLGARFAAALATVGERALAAGARLMPGGMHPLMDPSSETQLWPGEYNEVYATYDRIFDCKGHGWSNVQSMHVNLPWSGDAELCKLHAAVRVLLPLVPALAASSPYAGGRATGLLDQRLDYYRHNQRRVPAVTGRVIPEVARSEAEYRSVVLERIARDIAPHDPSGVLDPEWLNSRGAIVRFERNAIEIRLCDVQECPNADVAIADLLARAARALCDERWVSIDALNELETEALEAQLVDCIATGRAARTSPELARAFGSDARRVGDLLEHIVAECAATNGSERQHVELILSRGSLAERMLERCGPAPSRHALVELCDQVCACLEANAPLLP